MARSRSKIPFMMFQDVIMAVFGILIMIVIYLLITAKVSDIEFVKIVDEMRKEKASLGHSIESARAQREKLFHDAAKVVESRQSMELSKQVEANKEKLNKFDAEIRRLQAEIDADSKDLNRTLLEGFKEHAEISNTRQKVFEMREKIEQLRVALVNAELKNEKTERMIADTQSHLDGIQNQFRVVLDTSLEEESVYLVDFGGRESRAYQVYGGEQSLIANSSAKGLLSKVKADSRKKRVFFFVRPDAVNEFKKVRDAYKENNIAIGYQPLSAGEELVIGKFTEEDSPEGGQPEGNAQSDGSGNESAGVTQNVDKASSPGRVTGDVGEEAGSDAGHD